MTIRRGPLHDLIAEREPRWVYVHRAKAAADFGDARTERTTVEALGICDLSALPKLGLKGEGAEAWLERRSVPIPPRVYETRPLPDGGIIARADRHEFFLEEGPSGATVAALAEALIPGADGVHRIERQDATILLTGKRIGEVFAQTCGYDFRSAPSGLIMTRVAGVSCALLHAPVGGTDAWRIWCAPSYGCYLWEALTGIVGELGGGIAGLAALNLL